ncbi:MAG: hypothetical protein LBQ40_00990 [Clostridiales bacterium]|jgi:hypothetical protein|nr:hypothetical protein [Clostridiales bacterium]
MLKYFYNLYFQYEITNDKSKNDLTSTFNIGYFSTNKKAKEIIELYREKPGFKEHDMDCFKIQKIGVNFVDDTKNKEGTILYELSHEFETEDKALLQSL